MNKKYIFAPLRFITGKIGYTLINLTGLSVGIAVCIMLFMYIYDELSFNKFNDKLDRIHLVSIDARYDGQVEKSASTSPAMAGALQREYPEIEKVTRIFTSWANEERYMRYKENIIPKLKILGADSSFFDIFSYQFIKGNPAKSLNKPNTVVLTESTAKKFFGDMNPMGETVSFLSGMELEVTGVIKDCPKNADIIFDVLFSFTTLPEIANDQTSFLSTYLNTYALLKPNSSAGLLNDKMPSFVQKHVAPLIQEYFKVSFDDYFKNGDYYKYKFIPLKKVHLSPLLAIENEGKRKFVNLLAFVGLIVLVLASINYINLATAMSSARYKEIGVKKTFGANRSTLTRQFVGEAVFICFLSTALGMLLVEFMLPVFNNLMQKSYEINYFTNPFVLPGLLLFASILGILTGLYPGLVLSSQKTTSILRDKSGFSGGGKVNWFRNALVIFQFSVCTIIMIVTLTINQQIKYMQNKDLGFEKEQVLVLDMVSGLKDKLTFKEILLRNPNIIDVSFVNTTPARDVANNGHHVYGTPTDENYMLATFMADYSIARTLGLQLVKGRALSDNYADDKYGVLINESLANKINKKDPLSIKFDDTSGAGEDSVQYKVIGVVKDYNFQSLEAKAGDMVIYPSEGRERACKYALVKLSTSNINETVKDIEKSFKLNSTNYPFRYTFLDNDFSLLFAQEVRVQKLLTICILIAMFIASLGLLGLASYIIKKRTKEIGIRKSLGATISGIAVKLVLQFFKWIVIANLIAWPIAYYYSKNWLNGFAYRTDIKWYTFILVGLSSLALAALTIAYHTYKAASKKPVETLRYE